MITKENIFVIIDSNERADWKQQLHRYVTEYCLIASVKLRNYLKIRVINLEEFYQYYKLYRDEKNYLVSLPLNTRADYIKMADLCFHFSDEVLSFSPRRKYVSFSDHHSQNN